MKLMTQAYVREMKFIRAHVRSIDPVTQLCVEAAADNVRSILFPNRRW